MLIVVYALISILLLAVPGYIMKKKDMVGKDGLKMMSNLLLYITMPMLIFVNFQKMPFSPDMTGNLLSMLALTMLFFVVVAVFFIFVVKPQKRGNDAKLIAFGTVFCNSGFMAIPFLESLYPGNSLVIMYSVVFVSVFNIAMWTLGVYLITGDGKSVSLKKAIFNPAVISLAISLPLFVLNIRIADFSESIFSGLSSLSVMNTPVSMIVLGINLAESNMGEILKHKVSYITSAFRLLVCPLVMFVLIVLPLRGVVDSSILQVFYITMIMPGAASTPVMLEKFAGESKDGAIYFLLSTILSVVTIPLMMNLTNFIF